MNFFHVSRTAAMLAVKNCCYPYFLQTKFFSDAPFQKNEFFVFLPYTHWTEMPNFAQKVFMRLYCLDMTFSHTTGLLRYQGSQEKWKRPMKVVKAKSKASEPRGNYNHRFENSHLQTGRFKTGHFEMPRFPCSELQRLDLTHLWQNYINLLCQKCV